MTQYNEPEIQFEDFDKICRLCCKRSDELMSIYENKGINSDTFWSNVDVDIVQMLVNTVGLSVNVDDGLPESLCPECNVKLWNSNNFRKQCELATELLSNILMKREVRVKNEAANEELRTFDDSFDVTEYLDQNHLSTIGVDTVVKVEELLSSQENRLSQQDVMATSKRKRGRPKTIIETSISTSMSKRKSKSNDTKSSTNKSKKSERKDICLICGKIVNHNIKGHQAIHDTSKKYECDICGFQTFVKLYLKNHMKKKHVAQRQYPCPHCHLIFMHAITLKRHTTIHTGEKNHICEECGKSYRQRDMLTAHRKRHLPPTIQCSFCEKLFYSKNELKSHVGLHTGIKAFKCDICTAAFIASSSLAAHRRQHKKDNILPSCKLCGMMFNDRLTYNMHLMDHKRTNQSIAYNNR